MDPTAPEPPATPPEAPPSALGRAASERFSWHRRLTVRPRPTIGRLAGSTTRFGSLVGRPITARRALAPAAGTEVAPTALLPVASPLSPALAAWWALAHAPVPAPGDTASGRGRDASASLPARGLPTAIRPDRRTRMGPGTAPGGAAPRYSSDAAPVRQDPDVAAVGSVLTTREARFTETPARGNDGRPATPGPVLPQGPAGPAGLGATVRRTATTDPGTTPAAPPSTTGPASPPTGSPGTPAAPASPASPAGGSPGTAQASTSPAPSRPTTQAPTSRPSPGPAPRQGPARRPGDHPVRRAHLERAAPRPTPQLMAAARAAVTATLVRRAEAERAAASAAAMSAGAVSTARGRHLPGRDLRTFASVADLPTRGETSWRTPPARLTALRAVSTAAIAGQARPAARPPAAASPASLARQPALWRATDARRGRPGLAAPASHAATMTAGVADTPAPPATSATPPTAAREGRSSGTLAELGLPAREAEPVPSLASWRSTPLETALRRHLDAPAQAPAPATSAPVAPGRADAGTSAAAGARPAQGTLPAQLARTTVDRRATAGRPAPGRGLAVATPLTAAPPLAAVPPVAGPGPAFSPVPLGSLSAFGPLLSGRAPLTSVARSFADQPAERPADHGGMTGATAVPSLAAARPAVRTSAAGRVAATEPAGGGRLATTAPPVAPIARLDRPATRFVEVLAERRPDPVTVLPRHLQRLATAIAGPAPVQVRSGPGTAAALAAAGKRAATVGRVIHLPAPPDRSAPHTELVAHELVHAARPSPVPRFFDDDHRDDEEGLARHVGGLARSLAGRDGAAAPRRADLTWGTGGLPVVSRAPTVERPRRDALGVAIGTHRAGADPSGGPERRGEPILGRHRRNGAAAPAPATDLLGGPPAGRSRPDQPAAAVPPAPPRAEPQGWPAAPPAPPRHLARTGGPTVEPTPAPPLTRADASPLPAETLEWIIERVERHVLDELERRGLRHNPGVF